MVFAAKGGIYTGAPKGAHLASAAILYNSRGRSPQPACKAKPITGRTLGAQGQRPGDAINPHARKGVSTFGNTGKHRPGPDPGPQSGPIVSRETFLKNAARLYDALRFYQ